MIKIMGHHHIGMLREVLDMLHVGCGHPRGGAESAYEFDVDVFVASAATEGL